MQITRAFNQKLGKDQPYMLLTPIAGEKTSSQKLNEMLTEPSNTRACIGDWSLHRVYRHLRQ